ncbi:MAG: formyltransferase family protein [Gammaproteobacteria bacterium]
MSRIPKWWNRPRRITVFIDNDEWMLPWCEELVDRINSGGDHAVLCRAVSDLAKGAVAFLLSCHRIVPPGSLTLHHRNLVVHASELPQGRGMSPLTWQILEGKNRIPVSLLEAAEEVDAGRVIYRDHLRFEGHELIDEMRHVLAEKTLQLCERFLQEPVPPEGTPQEGEPSYWPRRGPADSVLDPQSSIADQFNLLRVVDNDRYPAFFDWRGHRYRLRIEKAGKPDTQE